MGDPRPESCKILRFIPKGRVFMRKQTEDGDAKKVTTSLTITKEAFDLLTQDARRCNRSMAGQLQTILDVIYLRRDVEMHGLENYRPSIELPDAAPLRKAG